MAAFLYWLPREAFCNAFFPRWTLTCDFLLPLLIPGTLSHFLKRFRPRGALTSFLCKSLPASLVAPGCTVCPPKSLAIHIIFQDLTLSPLHLIILGILSESWKAGPTRVLTNINHPPDLTHLSTLELDQISILLVT